VKSLFLALMLVVASPSSGDFYRGHQNTEPMMMMFPWDCERLKNFIDAEKDLFLLMKKHHMIMKREEIERVINLSYVYGVTCKEV
jgi:hypothetical protein